MNITLQLLEKELEVAFSKTFREFWNAHIPDKTLPFKVEKSNLREARFADVGRHPKYGWLIRVRNDLLDDIVSLEMILAHEIFHLVLYKAGYPGVCPIQGKILDGGWDKIAEAVHNILTHPIISVRLEKNWGFPVDEFLHREMIETLENIQRFDIPYPDQFLPLCSWLLTYIANRLDRGDQVCEMIARRIPFIASQGEEQIRWLESIGYSEFQTITPSKVYEVGQMLLERLEIDTHCQLCVMPGTNTKLGGAV